MGYGMSQVMVSDPSANAMVLGLILGIIGLVICILNYPVYAFLKK